jgi:hypothetical protein
VSYSPNRPLIASRTPMPVELGLVEPGAPFGELLPTCCALLCLSGTKARVGEVVSVLGGDWRWTVWLGSE